MSEVVGDCPRCGQVLEAGPVGCLNCHAIFPPPPGLTHFARLGLARRYAIEPAELEKQFLLWSRELHPDYFQLRSDVEKQLGLKLSAGLNDAYGTLKDPFRRAEYLLGLLGGPSASDVRDMPEEFLEEVLELRMDIAEAKESGVAQSGALRQRLSAEKATALAAIAEHFAAIETAPTPPTDLLVAIRRRLNTIKYLNGLLRDLE